LGVFNVAKNRSVRNTILKFYVEAKALNVCPNKHCSPFKDEARGHEARDTIS